ncbi:F-box domain protein [Rutstroemia sp. NJR-2017a BVV2]|nr:F-box domain protein [Rutstroemia sp. NJR-2017a BVV2]
MDISAFPTDIFFLVVSFLAPQDLILCRRVSQSWLKAFTESNLNRHLLKSLFPLSRESHGDEKDDENDWPSIFSAVAARYYCLRNGWARETHRFKLAKSLDEPAWSRNYPVAPWERYILSHNMRDSFHYEDTLWTYEDDLLVFPSAEKQSYVLLDLERQKWLFISFDQIVRRIRLKDRVLVVEWCEADLYHQLDEDEMVHRHFATAYDLVFDSEAHQWNMKRSLRNEWKIHFLGMPLNKDDRFFSVHSNTHYAIYTWQPNRGRWGEDDPIEALAIWDISTPSDYLPSLDPTGAGKPSELEGPRVIRRFSFSDLDFYNIRQSLTPRLRELQLDEGHLYILEENHNSLIGCHASYHYSTYHEVKSTGIPFTNGPRWVDRCGVDAECNRSYRKEIIKMRQPWLAPCWRHEEYPCRTTTEVYDASGIRYYARFSPYYRTMAIIITADSESDRPGFFQRQLRDKERSDLLGNGKLSGDERWIIGESLNQELVVYLFGKRPLSQVIGLTNS